MALDRREELLAEGRRLFRLALPVATGQLAQMMLGVVDAMMLGHRSVKALDAATLGNLWQFGTLIFGMGVVYGMDSIVSRAHGSKDERRLALALQRGLLAGLIAGIPIALLWLWTTPVLAFFGQDPELAGEAGRYLRVQIPGIFPLLGFFAFRQYQLGRGIAAPTTWVFLAANLVNALGDWLLIYGHLPGMPALGVVGAGLSTCITRFLMLAAIVAWTFATPLHHGAWVPWSRESFSPRGLGEVLGLGVPVGVQYMLETWAFQIATLWAGWISPVALAAHSIVLNLASLSFMVPLGISAAGCTQVGNRLGEGDAAGAKRSAFVALALGAGVMSVSALAFALLRHLLPVLYSKDPAVGAAAAAILPIAAAFQLFDGTQAVGGGVLRGFGNAIPAAVFNLVGYYALALPLAWWLAFRRGFGLSGIWWGLALGLAIIALALVSWIRWVRPPAASPRPAPG